MFSFVTLFKLRGNQGKVGRNMYELLRTVTALQTSDRNNVMNTSQLEKRE